MAYSFPDKVLIIGSGIGGLSTAIILARQGVEVTVLEKNSRPGGLMRSFTRKGIACEVGVHYLGSLDSGQILHKFFEYLGVREEIDVKRMGEGGVIDRYLFNPATSRSRAFDLPVGLDAFAENLQIAFPGELSTIAAIMAPIREAADQLHRLDLLYAGDNTLSLLDQSEPFGRILDNLGCSPELRSVLAIAASWIGVPLDDCPAYYHNMALASYVSSSYRLQESGADLAEIFARRLVDLGGKILTGVEVDKITVDSRKVTGVKLKSGQTFKGKTVIGAVHPQVVLAMLPHEAVKPSYRKRIMGLENTHGIFSLHAAIESSAHPEIPYNIFRIDTDPGGDVADLRYFQIRRSRQPQTNVLSILTSGREELWEPWENTMTGNRGREYEALKRQLAQTLLAEAEEEFGSLRKVDLLDTYTPLTLRDWVNSPGGSAYGVLRSSSQILATALLNRTAVKGLYLAGQNVMAPGMIGTIMGAFSTVKLLFGAEYFSKNMQI